MLIVPITVVLLLILVNGLFAMAEIALVSARTARLKALAESRQRRRPGRARAARRPLAAAVDGADRDHRDRGAVRHLRPGDLGRPPAIRARRIFRVDRPLRARAQHGGRGDRHLISVADHRRAGAEAHRALPSRADRRGIGAADAGDRAGGRADRVVFERLDRSRAAPGAVAQRGGGAGDRPGDQLSAARGDRHRPHPAGRNRDRRDGAAARRPAGQHGDDAAHPDRMARSRRS